MIFRENIIYVPLSKISEQVELPGILEIDKISSEISPKYDLLNNYNEINNTTSQMQLGFRSA